MSAGDWKEMYQAAVEGNFELVQYHIKNGVDPNYQHPEILSTALVASIINDHYDISVFLLDNGANPQLLSEFDNMTPLQAAKKFRRERVIELIEKRLQKPSFFKKIFGA